MTGEWAQLDDRRGAGVMCYSINLQDIHRAWNLHYNKLWDRSAFISSSTFDCIIAPL